MPLLPSHQEVHYEPLSKPSSYPSTNTNTNTNTKGTMISKLNNRRVILALVIVGLLGTLTVTRSYRSNEFSIHKQGTQKTNMWQSWKGATTPTVDAVKAITQEPAAATCSFVPPPPPATIIPSPPSSINTSEQVHYIAEEDWHMPSDVHLTDDNDLWLSRRKPFFQQIKGDVHRELGFGSQQIRLSEAPFVRRSLYRHLLQSFNTFAQHHQFHFWLAHGSLLGQTWGQKIMTGDTDIDVQCSLGDLHRVRQYEQQLWEDRFELVVNPHYLIRKTRNVKGLGLDKNVIDARWIDVLTGYYIDVTALSALQADRPLLDVGSFAEEEKKAIKLQDKSPHKYAIDLINPTKRCQFEGMDMWCPNKVDEILEEEYHNYDQPQFHTWRFNETIQAFNEITCPQLMDMYRSPSLENCDPECREVVKHERSFHWSALIMTGDIRKVGCLLKVSFLENGNKTTREYWGREDPKNKIKLRNVPNITYPAIVL